MTGVIAAARRGYIHAFGGPPDLIAYAPGRVNLIGEHTDYNDGFVLPCAIDFGTAAAMGRRSDGQIDAVALDLAGADGGPARDSFALPAPPLATGHFANHVRGVAAALARQFPLPGTNLAIAGDVPQGAGLSSSAALGVALATGWAALAGRDLSPVQRALAAQASEHDYVGTQCGIMDQLVAAAAVAGHAALIDCRSLAVTAAPVHPQLAIIIAHSGAVRELATSAYNQRRAECARAAAHYGVAALRDLTPARLAAGRAGLDPVAFARAAHVVGENDRVGALAAALASGNLAAIGALLTASHASLRDDFAVSVPPVDALVALIADVIGGAGGARMTGGGFGGCVVAITARDAAPAVVAAVTARHQRPDGAPALALVVTPAAGARLVA